MAPINIGNPQEITIRELAYEIKSLLNSESEIIEKDMPQDDPLRRLPDIGIAKKVLDWEPKISRSEGIKNTVEYFNKLLNK